MALGRATDGACREGFGKGRWAAAKRSHEAHEEQGHEEHEGHEARKDHEDLKEITQEDGAPLSPATNRKVRPRRTRAKVSWPGWAVVAGPATRSGRGLLSSTVEVARILAGVSRNYCAQMTGQ